MYDRKRIRDACNRAIKNILYEGITDVDLFSRPFEIDFLNNEHTKKIIVDRITDSIESKDFNNSNVKQYGKVLVPKKNLSDFRICAFIDIYDEVYYLTLAILMAGEIEKEKITIKKNKIYSYRFNSGRSNNLFKKEYNFTFFKEEVKRREKLENNNIVIECDISNFYDRLNLHRLESTLLSIQKVDNDSVELLNKLLLYWSNRDSYGIPVGSNASRIFAEALLINVDKFLEEQDIDFCRFVDDYRIFAKNATEAHKFLTILIERLQIEGLFVNSNKTNIREVTNKNYNDVNDGSKNKNKIIKENSKVVFSVKNNETTIIRGYSGLIPLKFRKLTEKERLRLKENNLNELFNQLDNSILIKEYDLKEYLKTTVAQDAWILFGDSARFLEKYPQFIPYYIDIFVKYQNEFNDETISKLQDLFKEYLKSNDLPEYIQIYVIRFFSTEKAFKKDTILNFFFNLSRVAGSYIGRATLEVLEGKLERRDLLLLRRYYERADIWEKRQILLLLNKGLPDEEKKAYFRNIAIANSDLFIAHMIKNHESI